MSHEVIHNAEHYVKKRRRKSRLLKLLAVLGCIVVFCTTYALILPAITSKTEIFCGLEEHVHTKECYVQVSAEDPVLTCSLQSLNVHVHKPECIDSEGKLICGLADYVAHTHNELCCDAEGNLVCSLEERDTHRHTESCYALPQTATQEQHAHEAACYTRTQGELICQTEETEGHSHSETCYTQGETLVCTLTDAEHVHEAACYESILSCELPETEGHAHGDECYAWNEEVACGMEEAEPTEQPSETQGDAFSAPDAHLLTCGMVEAETHVHSDACFCVAEQALTCTLSGDASHTHTELCYGVWELTCEIEEHTHGELCYSDPEADVEEAADWEKTFAEVELSGDWQQDVLNIAKTQLGYTESVKNYTVNEAGVRKGYSRYGQWFGDPYGDWCAMFTSFCMRYAGVDGIPINAACTPWICQLKEMNLFREQGEYKPYPGDLIFYDWESDGLSDHVGFVAEYIEATDTESAKIVALEGNSSDRVQYVHYEADDPRIAGYGLLSKNRLHRVYCGIDEHTHDEACFDAEGALTCTIEEHTHSDACNEYKLVYHNDALQVFVNIKGVSGLPADLTLSVTPVTREDAATFDAMEVALSREMASKTEYVGAAAFYSLQLFSEGQPYELPGEATVSVDMSFAEPVFTAEEMEDAGGMRTYVLSPEPVEEAPQAGESETADAPASEKPSTRKGASDTASDTDAQEPTEDSGSEEAISEPTPSYDAQPAEGEVLVEPENGITGVKFRSGEIATVAFALTRQTVTGTFWERVYSTDEIVSGGTYIIVSAEGNYALCGSTSTRSNYRAVTLETIKGNESYYVISGSENTDQRWTITKSGTSYTIRSQNNSGVYINLANSNPLSTSSASITLSYQNTEKVWRFSQQVKSGRNTYTYYLRNTGKGAAFERTSSSDYSRSGVSFYYTTDMLIFKLSDVTSLEVPADVVNPNETESGEDAVAPEKPDYSEIVDLSDSKKGETSVTGTLDDKVVSVKGEYYSDPATSDIELGFQADSFAEHELNDGKVLTDKSVIYMADDYGAFASYDVNTFGVVLSTMGQEYKVPYEDSVRTPIDMVFVLDASGSMTSSVNGGSEDRATTMVEAVNVAIDKIMKDHEANRVGIVLYSGGAWEMLPLGRYTAENGQYLVNEMRSNLKHDPMGTFDKKINFVIGGPTLKDEATGKSYANAGRDVQQGWGTYTQAGTALGKDLFAAIGDDTTYTTTVGEGQYEREITVIRQPVMVLLSDGEPTYSTNIYMDPLNGPHYGDGGGVAQNAKGIHGFYTVLTANYCKRMIGIQYQKPALFYTVGMGITSPDDKNPDGPAVSTSETGDNYKRAVLNPTSEIIATLTSNMDSASTTTTQFKNLINENFTDHTVQTQSVWSETWTGVPHIYTPVLDTNPYMDNYSYANGAYFDEEFSKDGLAQVFTDIIENSFQSSPYGFVLYKNSAIDIKDNIGYGMEMKGDPVLRYNGVNYTMTSKSTEGAVTTYVYDYIHVDPYIPNRECRLSEIIVHVEENYDGTQSVSLYVPDDVLPTYTPELIGMEYYYEMLPVRLIYQVGLTEESEEKVLALQETGGELTFYTNKWQDMDDVAVSTLVPHENNPFYNDIPDDGLTPQYHEHHDKKDENTTQTRENAVDCTKYVDTTTEDDMIRVVHYLGNNGKLVFRADTTEIPVEKTWQEVNPDIMNPVTVELYLVSETTNEFDVVNRTGSFVNSLALNAENQWKGLFEGVTLPDENSYYVVVEKPVSGYQAFYSGETVSFSVDSSSPITGVKVDFTEPNKGLVKITNAPAVELPSTGGPGEMLYTLGGCLLIAASGAALMYTRHGKRRKGDKAHS